LLGLILLHIPALPNSATMGAMMLCTVLLPALVGYWTSGGPAFRLVGLAVRRADGSPVSRWRCGIRNIAAWLLMLLSFCLNFALVPFIPKEMARATPGGVNVPAQFDSNMWILILIGCTVPLLMFVQLLGTIYALVRPQRGVQDHIAGTRLVPQ